MKKKESSSIPDFIMEPNLDDPAEELTRSRELLLAQQLALEQKQFERLKHDFKYNLQLLRERDAELEKYDLETAQLRAELEQKASLTQKAEAESLLRQRELAEERKRTGALLDAATAAERKQRETDEALARKTAEATRLQKELDEATSQRSEALGKVDKALAETAETRQDLAGTRNELTLRLQQQQHAASEAEDQWKAALNDERSAAAQRAKTARSEAARAESALQEQIDKLQVMAGEDRTHLIRHRRAADGCSFGGVACC